MCDTRQHWCPRLLFGILISVIVRTALHVMTSVALVLLLLPLLFLHTHERVVPGIAPPPALVALH
jgi:hypothetical protein